MRYFVICLVVLLFSYFPVNSQTWEWGQQFSGIGNIKPVDIAADANDNIYVVGTYDTDDMTVGSDVLSYLGNTDVFVSSFSSSGAYRWAVQINGTGINDVKALDIDENGDLYVIGGFRNATLHFTATDSLENYDHYDSYIAKYNSNGIFQYARRVFWGTNQERIQDVVMDRESNLIVVTGVFKVELIYFDGTTDQTITATGPKDQVIATFNYAGEIQDIVTYNTTIVNTSLKNISLCDAGGYFVGGDLRGRINFSGTEYLEGDAVNMDAMVFRVDDQLDYLWGRLGRGTGYDHINSMASDKYSNVYIAGKTESNPTTFDSTATLFGNPIAGFGASDIYLTKYNRDGILQWARRKGDAGDDDAFGLAVSNNTVQFAGNYAGQIIINQDTLDSGSLTNVNTGFAKYDFDGNEVGAQEITGDLEDRGKGIVFDSQGDTYVMGYFASTIVHAGPISFTNTNSPAYDGFVFKYDYPFTVAFTTVKHIICNGGNDGELTVTPYFGVPPYTYSWSHNAGLSDSSSTNLSAGFYKVVVTDNNSQIAEVSITLTEPDAIDISELVADVDCFGSNTGTIDITVTGGTGTKTYLWSTTDGSGLNPTQEDQAGLTAGTYDVLVTDENGCTENGSYVVAEPQVIIFGASVVIDIISPPGGNGAVDLVISGGTPAYTFSWTGPGGFTSTSEDITNLVDVGTYNLSLADANTCTQDTSFLVSSNTAFLAFISDKQDIICRGGNTGLATVSTTGGTGPYTYAWRDALSNSIGGDDPTLSGVPAGIYYVTVTDDSDSRTADANVTLQEPAQALTIVLSDKFNATCNGDDDGLINISVSGGWGTYSYAWTGPGGFTATSEDISSLGPGTYSVTVTDGSGCISTLTNIEITEPPILSVSIQINGQILCNGDLNGELEAMPVGGVQPYSYLWNDPGNQITKIASFLEAGNYTIIVTDPNGCTAQENQNVDEPGEIVITTQVNHISCGSTTGDIIATISGGTPAYSYVWYDELSAIVGTSKDLLGQAEGTYTLEVTDANNCMGVYVGSILQLSNLEVTYIDTANCSIRISATGGQRPYQYSTDGGMIYQVDSLFPDLSSGNYSVWVKDATDCEVDGGLVTLGDYCDLIPPPLEIFSAFSPNDDEWNNVWNIPGIQAYPNCVVKVFNSWGTAVFISPLGYPEPWDGSLNSGGRIVPAGTYYYVIDRGDGSEILSGTVNVVK